MKKLISVLFVATTTFLLIACGSNGKIRVRIGMWPNSSLTEDVLMFNEWKNAFELDHPEYEIIGDPYDYSVDTFVPKAQNGTLPTVFQTWFTEPQKLISNGYVKDITDALNELGWLEKMDDGMRAALTSNSRVYGIPRDGYGLGLAINLDIFEMVGLVDDHDGDGILDIHNPDGTPRYPTTMEELYETSQLIREHFETLGEDIYSLIVLSSNNNGGWQFANLAWNFGARLQYQQDGRWFSDLASDASVAALQMIKDLKWELDALPVGVSFSYNDWVSYFGRGEVAMAIAGNDALSLPITNFGFNRDHLAFVPMPAGPEGDQYSLFGGTPYMFSNRATDEQVMGALKFLEYMGRSPEVSQVSLSAMESGMATAQAKGMPILPTIKPWKDADYLDAITSIESRFINVNMSNFNDFFEKVNEMRHDEVPHFAQEMYEVLDTAIQGVLQNINANVVALLQTANNKFQEDYLNNM